MLVVMTCVFPNVAKPLPGIWIKYCADVAAWRDGLTGGNHSKEFQPMTWEDEQAQLCWCWTPTTVNPCSHQGSCCKACFWYTKPNQNTSSALNTPTSVFGSHYSLWLLVVMWQNAVFTSYQTGASGQIKSLRPLLRHPSIHPSQPISSNTRYLTLSLSVCFFLPQHSSIPAAI